MKQVLIRQGQAVVEEVPAPRVRPGELLVRVDKSCISIGTEMSGLKYSGLPLWKRGLRQPENVKKAIKMIAEQGLARTLNTVRGRISEGQPTGYSAAGTVLEVGESVEDFCPGDRVACGGAQYAHHAEIICVPCNLAVGLPNKMDFSEASTVTLGAIALQGVRRANPTLGETFVVVGLGILGQLTAQLLKANGCRVIGTDLDPGRIRLAQDLGMDLGVYPEDCYAVESVIRLTDGIGADGVIITASASSDAVISTAFRMCRKKGRVVLVGDIGLNLNRCDFYEKELDFFISSSYGPGRYDRIYEEKGLDYPLAYVRWTENRNMAEYLRLVAEGQVKVKSLITTVYSVGQAPEAYEVLKDDAGKPIMVLLSYPQIWDTDSTLRVTTNPAARPVSNNKVGIALVGAGSFAKGVHLPNLQSLSDRYNIRAIVCRTGHNAVGTAKQYGANYATTDYQEILNDPEVDAVLISTRHNLHASMALDALKAGKHVMVEKPLALSQPEIDFFKVFYDTATGTNDLPVLLTGFNRRFSRYAQRIFELVQGRSNPMILNYRMNAGYIPHDNWVHTEEGGGRNRGEACHIYDLFTFLTGSKVVTVEARAIRPATGYYGVTDNFVATLTFEDGSVATLTYTALGANEYPKEQLEVYVDGKVLVLNDYKKLTVFGANAKGLESKVAEKGHKEELEVFARVLQEGGEWPVPLWQQVQATEIALKVDDLLLGRCRYGSS